MVWFAARDLLRAVELFEQHDAREVVRQRDGAEGQRLVGALAHCGAHAVGAADDERDVARAVQLERVDALREALDVYKRQVMPYLSA